MTLYLYKTGAETPEQTLEQVASYTADQAIADDGTVYGPFAEGWELSKTADCAGTLRADWRADHPSQEQRIEDLEDLMANLLYGGDGE